MIRFIACVALSAVCYGFAASLRTGRLRYRLSGFLPLILLITLGATAAPVSAAPHTKTLAPAPPMGWNDWAHYQCGYTSQTILSNAKALVKSGLAADGYNTVTIDDCWMQKDRDAQGNLQVDPKRFPRGMQPVAKAVHALGLKFGIYEDAGYETCGGFAGSGEPKGGGRDHFAQDTKLFASWGVDYLKLDGCNVYVSKDGSNAATFRKAYAAQSAALKTAGRPIVFSESAPAYFQDTPDWYDVLTWVRDYGQLWREGTDIATYDNGKPEAPRFHSVLWNYAYNLPLGRFQKPGNWNDPDFIIGGDDDLSVAETRSQLALWSMMSGPLILSSDLDKLNPRKLAILSNKNVIAVDQDPLGRMATLVRRSSTMDVLLKRLSGGDYAVAVLNRGAMPIQINLRPADLGFAEKSDCRMDAQYLWSGRHEAATSALEVQAASHDTAIWRIHAAPACGVPTRTGTITMIVPKSHEDIESYSRCMADSGRVEACAGTSMESWTVTVGGKLKSGDRCLGVADGAPAMQACTSSKAQSWKYTLAGTLVGDDGDCLTASGPDKSQSLSMQSCGHNRPNQIWSLPN